MPPPSSENDLKRRARRRLIGAVALTLLAVIVLPQLLEDEPPPSSSLTVRMAVAPKTVPDPTPQPDRVDPPLAVAVPEPPAKPAPAPESKPEPVKAEPVKAEPVKPVSEPQPFEATVPSHKPAASGEVFVVQLAALSDSAKAEALKGRAILAGLPAYTDKIGSLTRVRVGPYASRDTAKAAAAKLAQNGLSGQVVAK
jgi:DedD protein